MLDNNSPRAALSLLRPATAEQIGDMLKSAKDAEETLASAPAQPTAHQIAYLATCTTLAASYKNLAHSSLKHEATNKIVNGVMYPWFLTMFPVSWWLHSAEGANVYWGPVANVPVKYEITFVVMLAVLYAVLLPKAIRDARTLRQAANTLVIPGKSVASSRPRLRQKHRRKGQPLPLAEFAVYLAFPRDIRDPLLADLAEEYDEVYKKFGAKHADLLYASRVGKSLWPQYSNSIRKCWNLMPWSTIVRAISEWLKNR